MGKWYKFRSAKWSFFLLISRFSWPQVKWYYFIVLHKFQFLSLDVLGIFFWYSHSNSNAFKLRIIIDKRHFQIIKIGIMHAYLMHTISASRISNENHAVDRNMILLPLAHINVSSSSIFELSGKIYSRVEFISMKFEMFHDID